MDDETKRRVGAVLDTLPKDSSEGALALLTMAYACVVIGDMAADGLLTRERERLLDDWLLIHNELVRAHVLSMNSRQLATLKERLDL